MPGNRGLYSAVIYKGYTYRLRLIWVSEYIPDKVTRFQRKDSSWIGFRVLETRTLELNLQTSKWLDRCVKPGEIYVFGLES